MPNPVAIECTKEGVKFSCNGDIGSGSVTLRSHTDVENAAKNIEINLSEPVSLTFSLKYLVNFCKASGLSSSVKLCLSNEVPLLVEYPLAESGSYLRFYLAPKVCLSSFISSGAPLLRCLASWLRLQIVSLVLRPWLHCLHQRGR